MSESDTLFSDIEDMMLLVITDQFEKKSKGN